VWGGWWGAGVVARTGGWCSGVLGPRRKLSKSTGMAVAAGGAPWFAGHRGGGGGGQGGRGGGVGAQGVGGVGGGVGGGGPGELACRVKL